MSASKKSSKKFSLCGDSEEWFMSNGYRKVNDNKREWDLRDMPQVNCKSKITFALLFRLTTCDFCSYSVSRTVSDTVLKAFYYASV